MLDALALATRPSGAPLAPTMASLQPEAAWQLPQAWTALLDELDYGILLVDADGAIVHTNRQARFQLRLDGLSSIWRCSSCPPDSPAARALRQAIRQSAERGLRGAVQLSAKQESLVVSVIPLPLLTLADRCLTMLLLQRQNIYTNLALKSFAKLHGLTDAEINVLESLCEGRAAQGIAQRQGVAVCTVRTQLQSLRTKLGVHSLQALLHLIGRLPPVMGVQYSDRK